MNLYKLNRSIHRDFGYFFALATILYALSGIALNHRRDWNPNYIVERTQKIVTLPANLKNDEKGGVESILKQIGEEKNYRKYYFPSEKELKVFMNSGGVVVVNLSNGMLQFENLKKRPLFNQINFLHYNPGKLWLIFSDLFAIGLITLSVSGLFILKGKNGITHRGAWLTTAGILVPLILFLMYY